MHACVDYLLLKSESKGWVTLLAQNMLKQPVTYVHTSKLTAIYTVLRVQAPRELAL